MTHNRCITCNFSFTADRTRKYCDACLLALRDRLMKRNQLNRLDAWLTAKLSWWNGTPTRTEMYWDMVAALVVGLVVDWVIHPR